jgi:hypothetical protein
MNTIIVTHNIHDDDDDDDDDVFLEEERDNSGDHTNPILHYDSFSVVPLSHNNQDNDDKQEAFVFSNSGNGVDSNKDDASGYSRDNNHHNEESIQEEEAWVFPNQELLMATMCLCLPL